MYTGRSLRQETLHWQTQSEELTSRFPDGKPIAWLVSHRNAQQQERVSRPAVTLDSYSYGAREGLWIALVGGADLRTDRSRDAY